MREESSVQAKSVNGELQFPCDEHGPVISRKPETFGQQIFPRSRFSKDEYEFEMAYSNYVKLSRGNRG